MSDQATERIFQDDIIRQLLANGWLLGSPDKYNRELALYTEDALGFVQETQDAQWQKFCANHPRDAEQKFLQLLAAQLGKADPNATHKDSRTFGTLGVLRHELRDADPALLQDALYDAEEYLRSELAENPGTDEATLLAGIAGSYGDPAEVAAIYRDTEVQVAQALRTPPPAPRASLAGRFFGVAADSRAWTALFYMLLSLATGIVYFTVVVTGLSVSAGMAVLVIGIPYTILFFASVRGLSLVEGRLVEVMLGERMPRRPLYVGRGLPWLERIAAMFELA